VPSSDTDRSRNPSERWSALRASDGCVAGLGSDGAGTRDDGSSPGQRPSIESFVGRLTIDVELELDTPGRLPFPSEQDDTAAANGKSHGTSRGSSSLFFFV